MELTDSNTIHFPGRWATHKFTHEECAQEIDKLASIVVRGCAAVAGVYLRLCDVIRDSNAPEVDIRAALSKHFPQPRVSEILRVARAPASVYSKYTAGFFGFRAALKQCRLYNITPSQELTRRQAHRAAARLVSLVKVGTIKVNDWTITISQDIPISKI